MNANGTKNNAGKILAAILVMAMVVAGAAVLFSEESTAAPSNTQYYSGDLDEAQVLNANVVINNELNITENGVLVVVGNLTINEGVEVNVEKGGQLIVLSGIVNINGTVNVTGNGVNKYFDPSNATNNYINSAGTAETQANSAIIVGGKDATDTSVDFKNEGITINGAVTFTKGAEFKAVGGKIADVLVANGGNLTVTSASNSTAQIVRVNVYLAVGGTFLYNGNTDTEGVTVTTYGTGDYKTTAIAKITGVAKPANEDLSDLTFTVTSKNINAYKYDSESDSYDTQVVRNYILNVDGNIDNNDTVTFSGTVTENLNGYYTSEEYAKAYVDLTSVAGSPTNYGYLMYDSVIMGQTIVDTLDVNFGSIVNDVTSHMIINGSLNADKLSFDKDNTEQVIGGAYLTNAGIIELVGTMTIDDIGSVQVKDGTLGTIAENGGSATIKGITDIADAKTFAYGAAYLAEDDDDTMYFGNLPDMIAGAQTAGVENVWVFGTANGGNTAASNSKVGAYVIDSNLTIPDDITLIVKFGLTISEGVTVTVNADAELSIETNAAAGVGMVYVDGELVDLSFNLEDLESYMTFQVKIVEEDVSNTYTTLANALSKTTSGTIYLYNDVVISGTMTIPENVTVQYNENVTDKKISFANENSALIINGTLKLANTNQLDNSTGTVTVNNMIDSDASITTATYPKIYGAYFTADLDDDGTPNYYITSAAVAAENSSVVTTEIVIYGKVAMGTVTFTNGEDNRLVVKIQNSYNGTTDKNVATGNVALVGAGFDMSAGAFTGSVASETTAGNTSVSFDKSKGITIGFETTENTDGTSNVEMQMTGTDVLGGVTISSGEVTIDGADVGMKFSNTAATLGTLAVQAGATLNIDGVVVLSTPGAVPTDFKMDLSEFITDNKTFDVAGTVNVNGTLENGNSVITGALNVLKNGALNLSNVINDGTIAVADDAAISNVDVEIMVLSGTLTGNMNIEAVNGTIGGAIIALPGSDVSGALIMWDTTNNETGAAVSDMYINGDLYATVYATEDGISISMVAESSSVSAVKKETAKYYSDAAHEEPIEGTVLIGAYPEVYVTMDPATVPGTITTYNGLTVYIDGLSLSNLPRDATGKYVLDVGSHEISVQINPAYTGTYEIALNGQAVTDGTFEITDDMDSFQLIITGDLTQNQVVIDGGSNGGDDGLGLTDILLIILVILIVVMAIMVALRLMRS